MTSANGRLILLAKAGNLEEVVNLLNGSAVNVNYAEWNGDTAISMAASFGHISIVKALIASGADVNSKDKKGESALMLSCNKGFIDIARILLEHGANVNNQSKVGYTALMGATINGLTELVQLLVAKGATLDLKNNEGKVAADFAKTEAVRELLLNNNRIDVTSGETDLVERTESSQPVQESLHMALCSSPSVMPISIKNDSLAPPNASSSSSATTPPPAAVSVHPPPPSDERKESQLLGEPPLAPVVSPTAVGSVPFTKPPPPRRGSSSPVPAPPPPPMPSPKTPFSVSSAANPPVVSVAEVTQASPAAAELDADAAVPARSDFSTETSKLEPEFVTCVEAPPAPSSQTQILSQPNCIDSVQVSTAVPTSREFTPPISVAPPVPSVSAGNSTPVPYILSDGQSDLDEHAHMPTRFKVSEMYARLVLRCQGHVASDNGNLKLPYDVFLRRLLQLQSLYDGSEGLVESARATEQECVVEYYALHFEKALQEALRVLEPPQRRSILALSVGNSEQKTLVRFAEVDEALTRCSQELFEALEAVRIDALTSSLQRLPRLGPPLVYQLHEQGGKMARSEEVETEDPHTPLLLQPSGWASRLASSLSTPGKDGKLRMFNLSRPTVAPTLRRKPSLRKFIPEEDPSVRHLLPSYAGIVNQWRQAFGGLKQVEETVALEKWIAPQDNPVAIKPHPLEAKVRAAVLDITEQGKWNALPNLAEGASTPTSLHSPPPVTPPPPPPLPPRPPKSPASAVPNAPAPLVIPGGGQGTVASAAAKRSASTESPEPTASVPSAPPARSPKRIDHSLIAALGNFDPSKTPPPRGGVSPLRGNNTTSEVSVVAGRLGGSADSAAASGAVGLQSASVDSNASANVASPHSVSAHDSINSSASKSSSSSIQSNNLDRAVVKPRRAPTKKKFETKVEDLPPVPVVPIAVEPDLTSTPVTKQHKGGIWKAIFGSSKSATANTSTKSNAVSVQGSDAGSERPSLSHPSAVSAAVLDDNSSAASPCTPKTPASGNGGISGIFTSLGLKSKKSSKKQATTLSPALTESSLADNMRHLQSGLDMVERASESSMSGVHHGLVGTAGKVVVQNVALAGVQLPIVGAVAVLLLQLIDLCDAYKCNMKLFLALKARMQFLYRLYFAEGGVADVAHQKGKDSVVEPFARHLEMLILDAIAYLTAFTEKGFFHKLLSGRRPQQRFAEIDADITKCLDGLTVALQLLHIADLSAALDALQAQKTHQEVVYEVVTDIQRRVDRIGGLHGVKSMRLNELQALCVELGVRDAAELREEIDQCEERLEDAAEHVSETVREVKSAVSGADQNFTELKDMVSSLQDTSSSSRKRTANSVDLDAWRPKETPRIDRKQLLGSGSFGSVFGGIYLGRSAAFKVPNSHVTMGVFAANSFPELQREVRLHLKVNACPGVVRILAVALQADEICAEPCVIMERAIGSLYDFLHKSKHRSKFLPAVNFSLTGKLTLALQVAAALEYISSAGLIHRDIKASNVLLFYEDIGSCAGGRDPEVCAKISDFGLSRNTSLEGTVDLSSHISVKGTPSYLAPEAFNAQYSVASDVFAFGILLNEILTEKLPVPISVAGPNAPNIFQLKDAVCRDQHRPSLYAEEGRVADALRRLITRCWSQDPTRRCAFAQVTIELTNILHAAVTIAKYGSAKFEQGDLAALLNEPTVSVLSRQNSRASVTTGVVGASASAFTTTEDISHTVTSATITTLSAGSAPTSPAALSHTYQAVPSVAPTVRTRSLEELTVEEVGALMEAIQMHPLKEVLMTHRVSGLMLACVETVDDLLSSEYGLQSRGLAGGLMRKIVDWKLRGVPLN